MKACKVDEEQLAAWIDGATGMIRYLGPAITERLARKILAAEKRTGERNHVVIELDDEVDRSGYGQTAGVRILHDHGTTIQHRAGLRVAAITAPGIGAVWSPIAERVDPIERVSVNGIWMEGAELCEFRRWMGRMMGKQGQEQSASQGERSDTPQSGTTKMHDPAFLAQDAMEHHGSSAITNQGVIDELLTEPVDQHFIPAEPKAQLSTVDEETIKEVETHLQEHPPRDFKEEKQTEVYQGYVGFIEIHVTGASLSRTTTLAIPKELTELGLENDLRNRLSERMRIDLSSSVDLGARDVNRRVDAFREMFTRQLGPPLGRIYKKSEWLIMQTKWAEIEVLVESANEKIKRSMHAAVEKVIMDAAKDWAKAIDENPNVKKQVSYTTEDIHKLLLTQWDRKQRATRMRVQLFVKDLTWGTLNDQEVREKIEEAYPELCTTGLYKSRRAWAAQRSAT
ncbi:MAG: hypothetical protein OXE57_20765 [Alphaproteobacteria bacterium]|nr:hypothetical protein [Alphaproteobacteria bacterium]